MFLCWSSTAEARLSISLRINETDFDAGSDTLTFLSGVVPRFLIRLDLKRVFPEEAKLLIAYKELKSLGACWVAQMNVLVFDVA
jgi:hypothetical protein